MKMFSCFRLRLSLRKHLRLTLKLYSPILQEQLKLVGPFFYIKLSLFFCDLGVSVKKKFPSLILSLI